MMNLDADLLAEMKRVREGPTQPTFAEVLNVGERVLKAIYQQGFIVISDPTHDVLDILTAHLHCALITYYGLPQENKELGQRLYDLLFTIYLFGRLDALVKESDA